MKELKFKDLTKDDVEVRVQSCGISKKGNKYARLLPYKNARIDMRYLDETLGCMNWQRKQYECKGNLYCEIGVYDEEKKEWVWKGDCGKPSNAEKEKGESSDAFKRAGFCWGIGRELYTSPDIWVYGDFLDIEKKYNPQTKKEVYSCNNNFKVTNMKVVDKIIVELTIEEEKKGVEVFNYKADSKKNTKATPKKATTKAPETSVMDKKTFDALMKLSEIMKEKGIKEESIKEKYQIKGSLKALEYNAVLNILKDLQ